MEGEMFKIEHNGFGPSAALTFQLVKSQLRNLRRVFNPKPANRNDLLGDKLGDVPIAVELRRADVAGVNVTRPS
jgi:hypothetical protein